MLLRERLLAVARERDVSLPGMRRIESALRTLDAEIGPLDLAQLVGRIQVTDESGEIQFAQQVYVPGDDARYVVIGHWEDGSMDVVREQGSFPSDCLVGWRPGQPLNEFHRDLATEVLPEVPRHARGKVVPLR